METNIYCICLQIKQFIFIHNRRPEDPLLGRYLKTHIDLLSFWPRCRMWVCPPCSFHNFWNPCSISTAPGPTISLDYSFPILPEIWFYWLLQIAPFSDASISDFVWRQGGAASFVFVFSDSSPLLLISNNNYAIISYITLFRSVFYYIFYLLLSIFESHYMALWNPQISLIWMS